jgi:hypothetical protein
LCGLEVNMNHRKNVTQLIWGVALLTAGIGVFFRIPQVLPQMVKIEQFNSIKVFIYFCFYFMAVILVGGGLKKIYQNFRERERNRSNR